MASRPSLPNLRSRRTVSRQPRRMTPTTLTPSRITTKRTTDSKATRPRLTTNPPIPSPPTRSSRHTAGYAQKSKLAAGLLGIFLGCFGVHNFYLGNTGKAVAQLLLTVIGWILIIGPAVAGIWGLVEGILILCSHYGSQWHRDAQGVELQD